MSIFFKRLAPTALTMGVGIVTLAMYFLPGLHILPDEEAAGVLLVRAYWIEVAAVIAAFAMLLGVFNLLSVHWGRIIHRRRGWFFSFVAIVAAVLVLTVSVAERGVAGPNMMHVYQFVLYPLQSSFTALLAFLLAFAAYRTLRLRRGVNALLFLGAALVVLAAQAMPGWPIVPGLRDWLVNVWATAGLRGVLLGIALGTLATMVRVLLGFDRPASE